MELVCQEVVALSDEGYCPLCWEFRTPHPHAPTVIEPLTPSHPMTLQVFSVHCIAIKKGK